MFKNVLKLSAVTMAVAVAATLAASPARAIPIELGLAIDGSGSISTSNFALQRNAYINVLQDVSVLPQDGSVAVGISQFSSFSTLEFPTTVITGATIGNLIAALTGMTQQFGGTNIGAAINQLTGDIFGNGIASDKQVIDVSTDGFGSLGTSVTDALTAGIEQINCLGIGAGANCSFAAGTGSFSVTVASFADFEAALRQKIIRETGGGDDVPAPGALSLLGLGLLGLAFYRRRRAA